MHSREACSTEAREMRAPANYIHRLHLEYIQSIIRSHPERQIEKQKTKITPCLPSLNAGLEPMKSRENLSSLARVRGRVEPVEQADRPFERPERRSAQRRRLDERDCEALVQPAHALAAHNRAHRGRDAGVLGDVAVAVHAARGALHLQALAHEVEREHGRLGDDGRGAGRDRRRQLRARDRRQVRAQLLVRVEEEAPGRAGQHCGRTSRRTQLTCRAQSGRRRRQCRGRSRARPRCAQCGAPSPRSSSRPAAVSARAPAPAASTTRPGPACSRPNTAATPSTSACKNSPATTPGCASTAPAPLLPASDAPPEYCRRD